MLAKERRLSGSWLRGRNGGRAAPRRRSHCAALAALPALLAISCGASIAPIRRPAPLHGSRCALVIGIDGLRPDAMSAANAPELDSLFAEGLFTLRGTTQLRGATSSAPGWASVMTGVEADEHGVLENGMDGAIRLRAHPTFLARAVARGHRVGVATEDPRVVAMLEPELAAHAHGGDANEVTRAGAALLADENVDLVFVVLEDVDDTGHATGFSSDNRLYLAAVERVDRRIGVLLEAMRSRRSFEDEEWLVVTVSDHAGEGYGHGPRTAANRTIPIAYSNARLRRGELDERDRSQVRVAATVLEWLAGDEPEALRPLRR